MAGGPSRRSAGLVLAGMTAANAMILVDQTAVPLTLPDIMTDFHIGSERVQWVLNASLLMLAGLLVLGGRLGDLLGRRRIFLLGCVLFAGASAAAGLAPEFPVLIAARVVQGAGGALMLPGSVALVSAAFTPDQRGRALGTMGGIAAVAGALGPTIGGVLTSAVSWRAVLLVNVPLAVVCIVVTLRSVPPDGPRPEHAHVDLSGSLLLCVALVAGVYGLSETQDQGVGAPEVSVSLVLAAIAAVLFVLRERQATNPLMDLGLLGRSRNYLGAVLSQGLAGMAEMGLGVIFPLLLILNLEMSPALAGLALVPSTVPMVVIAPLAGRWYDRVGGRIPLVVGFAVLAGAGVALAIGVQADSYAAILPGLLLYGVGLAIVLTTNDPVSLDTIAEADEGQASGVSATAEQGGGAVGIAVLYALFHVTYVDRLFVLVDRSPLADLTGETAAAFREKMLAAESTGLRPDHFDPTFTDYLVPARDAAVHGYTMVFVGVAVIAALGAAVTWWLVRRPAGATQADADAPVAPAPAT